LRRSPSRTDAQIDRIVETVGDAIPAVLSTRIERRYPG